MHSGMGWLHGNGIFFYFKRRLMQRNKFFSIKAVNVDTVKIKNNSYGKNIRDKMMCKIKKKEAFRYHEGGEEL